jgi:hypothetical protein
VRIDVSVPSNALAAGHVTTQLLVITTSESPRYARIPLAIRAYVRVPIHATPAQIVFGKITETEVARRRITIRTDPKSIAAQYLEARSENPFIKVALHARQPGWMVFEIGLAPDAPTGDLTSSIQFRFSDPANPELVVPVIGQHVGVLRAVPSRLSFPANGLSQRAARVRIESQGGEPFEILGYRAPENLELKWETSTRAGTSHEALVQTLSGPWPDGDAIIVITSLLQEAKVRIPIVAY